ncbi:MAG: 7-cyano-7-deazaguanine synthase QueC [Candidatus Omnitrophota bacterium]
MKKDKKAIVLLSGGMDSAVTLYMAKQECECKALIFNYGQKAFKEIEFAKKLSDKAKVPFYVLDISLPWKGSSLLDETKHIPDTVSAMDGEIPSTYVPARNIIFLSFGISFAEADGADAVFIGAHQHDFSNYPDCRDSFFESFRETVRQGTKQGTTGNPVKIKTPIISKTKNEIVRTGLKLGVPFEYTWSCYSGEEVPCGVCESCRFRIKAFESAGIRDPFWERKN